MKEYLLERWELVRTWVEARGGFRKIGGAVLVAVFVTAFCLSTGFWYGVQMMDAHMQDASGRVELERRSLEKSLLEKEEKFVELQAATVAAEEKELRARERAERLQEEVSGMWDFPSHDPRRLVQYLGVIDEGDCRNLGGHSVGYGVSEISAQAKVHPRLVTRTLATLNPFWLQKVGIGFAETVIGPMMSSCLLQQEEALVSSVVPVLSTQPDKEFLVRFGRCWEPAEVIRDWEAQKACKQMVAEHYGTSAEEELGVYIARFLYRRYREGGIEAAQVWQEVLLAVLRGAGIETRMREVDEDASSVEEASQPPNSIEQF